MGLRLLPQCLGFGLQMVYLAHIPRPVQALNNLYFFQQKILLFPLKLSVKLSVKEYMQLWS